MARYTTDLLTLMLARNLHQDLLKREARFEQDRHDWYASGPGRSPNWRDAHDEDGNSWRWNAGGDGHAFPAACVHGSSAYTDYDNICGPCEDGYSLLEIAMGEARSLAREFRRRGDMITPLRAEDTLPTELRKQLDEWSWNVIDHALAREPRPDPKRLP